MNVRERVRTLGKISLRWLDPEDRFRKQAARKLARRSGFSPRMADAMIDATFSQLTAPRLAALLRSEIGDARVLDGFHRGSRARGPESILHVLPSNVPNASVWSLVFGMLVGSRNIAKTSSRDEGILDIYLRSLRSVDRKLTASNRVISGHSLAPYIKEAGLVVAYGTDETLEQVRKSVPASTPFIGYGHRLSAAVFAEETLKDGALAARAAQDVWMADQRGCLSPMTFFVEKEGPAFAGSLALALRRVQKDMPARPAHASFAARQKTDILKLKSGGFVLESSPRGLWAVQYEKGVSPGFGSHCQVAVRSFDRIEQVYAALTPLKKHLQCVALECSPAKRMSIAEKLSSLGVNRVCRAGKMQIPPITWHHDGKLNLASWLNWTDLEN